MREIHETADGLQDALDIIGRASSGSPIGFHSRLYYENFDEPGFQHAFDREWVGIHGIPSYWVEQTPESVKAEIERRSGTTIEVLESLADELRDKARSLHTEVCVALAPARSQPGFEREAALLDQLEGIEFEQSAVALARTLIPQQQMTRDRFAVSQGIQDAPAPRRGSTWSRSPGIDPAAGGGSVPGRCGGVFSYPGITRRRDVFSASVGETESSSPPACPVSIFGLRRSAFEHSSQPPVETEQARLAAAAPAVVISPTPGEIEVPSFQLTSLASEQPVLRPPLPAMVVEAAPLGIEPLSFKPTPQVGETPVRSPDAPPLAVSPAAEGITSLSFQLTPPPSEAPVLAPAAPPVAVSPAPHLIESHSFQLRPPTTGGRTPAQEMTARGERAYPDSSPPATTSRRLTARKDGQLVLRLGLLQDDSAWVVECEVYPAGRASVAPKRPGPYTFKSREQARVFLDETEKALRYLGCQVDDRVESFSADE